MEARDETKTKQDGVHFNWHTSATGKNDRYIGIPRNDVPIFQMERVLALFSRVKRHDWQSQ